MSCDDTPLCRHNEQFNPPSVCSIGKVVKKLTMKKAYEVTMETHKAGRATVTQAWKAKVLYYAFEADGEGYGHDILHNTFK